MMPAFSVAMASRVWPRNSVWSSAMLVISAQSASTALTASSRPPMPTSRITRSSGAAASSRMMTSVVNSNQVRVMPCRADSTAAKCGSNAAALTISPFRRQRSSKCTRCGLLYSPTR